MCWLQEPFDFLFVTDNHAMIDIIDMGIIFANKSLKYYIYQFLLFILYCLLQCNLLLPLFVSLLETISSLLLP